MVKHKAEIEVSKEYPYALTVWLTDTKSAPTMLKAMQQVLREVGQYDENNNPIEVG